MASIMWACLLRKVMCAFALTPFLTAVCGLYKYVCNYKYTKSCEGQALVETTVSDVFWPVFCSSTAQLL